MPVKFNLFNFNKIFFSNCDNIAEIFETKYSSFKVNLTNLTIFEYICYM